MKKLLFTAVVLFVGLAWGQGQDPVEKKAQSIDKLLIAPCCWTSTLDQHFSQEAETMKDEIRTKLSQNQSKEQILEYFEKKYGERILSEPKKAGFNMTVWIFPIFALGFGIFILLRFLNKSKVRPAEIETEKPKKRSSAQDEKYKKIIDNELYRS